MEHELAAGRAADGRGHADLDAELVRLVRLAFADALHFRGVERIDLAAPFAALLREHPARKVKLPPEGRVEGRLFCDRALDVAHDPPEIGLERAKAALG